MAVQGRQLAMYWAQVGHVSDWSQLFLPLPTTFAPHKTTDCGPTRFVSMHRVQFLSTDIVMQDLRQFCGKAFLEMELELQYSNQSIVSCKSRFIAISWTCLVITRLQSPWWWTQVKRSKTSESEQCTTRLSRVSASQSESESNGGHSESRGGKFVSGNSGCITNFGMATSLWGD